VDVRIVPGDHMVLIDPVAEPWRLARDWLCARATRPPDRSTLNP
jgi:hypothetical protein